LSIQDFWQLLLNAQLMAPDHCQRLQQQFSQIKGAMNGNGATLAEWLISQRQLSRFQAKVLLSGQPGPFVFGNYRVYDRVEQGRLSGLFRAVHLTTNHPVLLQFLSGPNAQNVDRLAHCAKRASISAGIHHPHVLRCLHLSDLRAYKFLALEDLHGQSLDELLAAKGPLPPSEACRIARQAALGLMRLEELKMVHGEVRPANVWINHLGTVKLLEFPLWRDPLSDAAPFDAGTAANPNSQMAIAADYLAPELARGGGKPDIRADIYGLGCVLYQMLTGQVPFPESNAFRKVLRHATEAVEPPDRVNANVPTAVSQLVMYMMAKDPNQRYQQAAHVAEALVPYIDPNGLSMFADPPTAPGQAYEAWLTQNHPAASPEPDTGEFNFNVKPGEFQAIKSAPPQAAAFPSFGPAPGSSGYAPGGNGFAAGAAGGFAAGAAPGFPQQQPPAGFPNGNGGYANGNGGYANGAGGYGAPPQGGFPQQGGFAAPQQGGFAPQGGFGAPQQGGFPAVGFQGIASPEAGPSFGMAGPAAAISSEQSQLERERIEEERFNKKMTNIAVTVGSTLVIGLVALIAIINLNSPAPVEDEIAQGETKEDEKGAAKDPTKDPSKTDPTKKNGKVDLGSLELNKKPPVATKPPEKIDMDLTNSKRDFSKNKGKPDPKSEEPKPEVMVSADSVWGEVFTDGPQWASPTSGPPLDLKYLIPSCQVVVALRPAEILASPEGKRVFEEETLGPLVRFVRSTLESNAGVPLEEMEQVLVGLVDGSGDLPKMAMVVRTLNVVNENDLVGRWGKPAEVVVDGKKIMRGAKFVYHFPPTGAGKVFCMAPAPASPADLDELCKFLGGEMPPLMRKEMEGLLEKSDARRHCSIFFAPSFLFAGGKSMFETTALGKLRAAVNGLLLVEGREYAKAAMLSFHFGDEYFYTELRVDGGAAKQPMILARDLKAELTSVPEKVHTYYNSPQASGARSIPTEYSRAVLARYPMMLNAMAGYLRSTPDGRHALLTTVLPSEAAHNLALGTQLALLDPGVVLSKAGGDGPKGPKDIHEALKKKISLKVPSDSFDRIVPLIAEELGYKIVFNPDLETRGITKNKRFGIDEKDKTIEEVLMAVCREANPTGGVKDMASPDMILIWAVAPGDKEVQFTIRENAKDRGKISPAFGIK